VIYIAVLFFSCLSNGYVGAQYERPFYAKIGIGWFAYQRGYIANVELTRGAVHRSPESLQPVGLSALGLFKRLHLKAAASMPTNAPTNAVSLETSPTTNHYRTATLSSRSF